jgi:electron transport complex protein RnfB
MDDVYSRLADRLDELPNGFPRTQGGVELRILRRIFSPEDAAMALKLRPVPETVEAVAARLRRSTEELRPILDGMTERGQIMSFRLKGRKRYMLAPFVVGIYEFQLPRMDAELAEMFEEYAPTLLEAVGGSKPALARVVPVNSHIDASAKVLRHENVREMISAAQSFRLMECICRKEQAALGNPCSHTLETCMAFSREPDAYLGTLPPGYGRVITREEALAVLDLAEQEGLVHCTYNLQRDQMFVCNCCSCCCGFLRGVRDFGAPHLLVRSDYVATIAAGDCLACGDCGDGRCPMSAITEADAAYQVDGERCIGCGVCAEVCPSGAITLVPRPPSQRSAPAKTVVSWSLSRSIHRRGLIPALAQAGGLALETMRTHRAMRRARGKTTPPA